MKIVFTGGGTGGHFYPIIAVAQKINKIIDTDNILGAKLYYFSDDPYDPEILFENGILYEQINAGKLRTYFSLVNLTDVFKTIFGTVNAIYKLFTIYPDVVFGKGGYASFPTIFAAIILRIPVIIHESDSAPGRVNKWAGRFSKRVAVSFKEATEFFPQNKVAWTGHPIRTEIEEPTLREEALKYFKFEVNVPVIFIIGGSQGSELINNTILNALPRLVKDYHVIHQTGVKNFKIVKDEAEVVLSNSKEKSRYMPIAFLNPLSMKMAAGVATLVISRAGSTLFEIASWEVPSILIPIAETNLDHQKKNAYAYAHAGACSVIEESNITANILSSEIENMLGDKVHYEKMTKAAKAFHKGDAAMKIARELVNTALSHEK